MATQQAHILILVTKWTRGNIIEMLMNVDMSYLPRKRFIRQLPYHISLNDSVDQYSIEFENINLIIHECIANAKNIIGFLKSHLVPYNVVISDSLSVVHTEEFNWIRSLFGNIPIIFLDDDTKIGFELEQIFVFQLPRNNIAHRQVQKKIADCIIGNKSSYIFNDNIISYNANLHIKHVATGKYLYVDVKKKYHSNDFGSVRGWHTIRGKIKLAVKSTIFELHNNNQYSEDLSLIVNYGHNIRIEMLDENNKIIALDLLSNFSLDKWTIVPAKSKEYYRRLYIWFFLKCLCGNFILTEDMASLIITKLRNFKMKLNVGLRHKGKYLYCKEDKVKLSKKTKKMDLWSFEYC